MCLLRLAFPIATRLSTAPVKGQRRLLGRLPHSSAPRSCPASATSRIGSALGNSTKPSFVAFTSSAMWRAGQSPSFGRTRTEFEPLRLLAGGWGSTPAVNMIEKENAYELTGELAGMDESNIELKVAGGVLTIKGEKKEEKDADYVLSERRFGSIQRSIPLPEGIDLERIEASFKKGVLTVTMPKTPEAQKSERKIAIKGG